MGSRFHAAAVTDTVWWVGAIDWNTRDFHGYLTQLGTTYNAYLVMADKITLIDTVKRPYCDELFERIASVIDPSDISYIISNHAEPDHASSLAEAIDRIKPEKVFASKMGVKALDMHFHGGMDIIPVGTGDMIDLGNRTVSFMETKMLHWPDSMFSYLADEKLLFSNDAFGMHLASTARFADEHDEYLLTAEAKKYYANIVLPYSNRVEQVLAQVAESGIDLDIVCPDHGPIWRRPEDIARITGQYGEWAAQKPSKRAMVVYDTMWMSTDKMAHAIAEGIADGGVEVSLKCLKANHRSDIAKEILGCGALVAGSPTLNNNLFPTVVETLTYLKGLKPKNLIGAAFGSYGWSGEGAAQVEDILRGMGVELVADTMKVQYVPDTDALDRCYALGTQIAETLIERLG